MRVVLLVLSDVDDLARTIPGTEVLSKNENEDLLPGIIGGGRGKKVIVCFRYGTSHERHG